MRTYALNIKAIIMRWVRHLARMVERRGAYRVLLGKPERKGQLVRPRRRCEYNFKMYLQEASW
jgi:hypothetical protein